MTLEQFFEENPKLAIGFSGGVDSSYLLYAARRCGADVRAYYVRTPFQPEFEYRDACRIAKQTGTSLHVIELRGLPDEIADNPPQRCYLCKRRIFSAVCRQAAADGYTLTADGTNASDDVSDRPGVRALRELGVCSPLRECGLTKEQIRELSKEAGLFTWDKPAYACLATRIAAGQRITEELLAKVEAAENALFALGFSDFRVRVSGHTARLQVKEEQMERVFAMREQIKEALSGYFDPVTLDLKAR